MGQTTRTFRIFVSSTFSDLIEERNALQKYVFPRLRELCTQHGCRFQAIDLRWGVRDEAGLDQQTMKICLDEVSRSQRSSPRPNFIVLLGDRYGWRPLPAEIPANELEAILPRVTPEERELLLWTDQQPENNKGWYRCDDNAKPPVYRLQPRRKESEFADFNTWEKEIERPLRRILLKAIEGMNLAEGDRKKYEDSATEQEIDAGAMTVSDANEHVFCFFRAISALPESQSARDFIDVDETGSLDRQASDKLKSLKGRVEKRLPGNFHHYNARWTGGGITANHIGVLPENLEECLRLLEDESASTGLCFDVWRRLATVILEEIARLEKIEALEKEVADHKDFAENRAKSFIGRASILKTILDYVAREDRHPLAVWGESGSGKSALMAKAIADCASRIPNAVLVSRFIGATPGSSDARSLVESLCRQVTRIYGGDETTIPTEYKELVKEMPQRLALAKPDKPLVVFLDALDQLSDADHARNLIWLPGELPEHAHLVVSTLPGECKVALDRKLPSNLLKLEPMPRAEADELLEAWLTDADRTLQSPQKNEVLRKFDASARPTGESSGSREQGGMPLYLKLAFEEARRWKSYSPIADLAGDIPGIIRQLFERLSLDANHGKVVVSRSLGYLAASKNGLTEDELLDVLSRDEEVLGDFKSRAKHTPPEERLPIVVWSRLYFDLEPYLAERSADGASLMSFYHRQLREVVEETFLAGNDKGARHSSLAEYFASQELFEKEKKTPNIRKLSELPYQQTYGEKWDELHATLTDFDFLEAKCTHVSVITPGKGEDAKTIYGGVYELQEDYRRALDKFPA
ncbi:MAG: AAA family ATPase [Acidobacteriota bacterium]